MKYLKNFENHQYLVNEGFKEKLKNMAAIGLLTASMLSGDNIIAQKYRKLDNKTKTEISNKVNKDNLFKFGELKMKMTIDEFKKLLDSKSISFRKSRELPTLFDDSFRRDQSFVDQDIEAFNIKEYKVANESFEDFYVFFYKGKLFLIEIEIDYDILSSLKKMYKNSISIGRSKTRTETFWEKEMPEDISKDLQNKNIMLLDLSKKSQELRRLIDQNKIEIAKDMSSDYDKEYKIDMAFCGDELQKIIDKLDSNRNELRREYPGSRLFDKSTIFDAEQLYRSLTFDIHMIEGDIDQLEQGYTKAPRFRGLRLGNYFCDTNVEKEILKRIDLEKTKNMDTKRKSLFGK
jgi:hypothetical protein